MEKRLTILSSKETNEFADPRRANNGGGYHQPEYLFEYNGIKGLYRNTSCGDFGTRYMLEYDGQCAYWGSMYDDGPSSTFDKDKYYDFLIEFMREFKFKYMSCDNDEFIDLR